MASGEAQSVPVIDLSPFFDPVIDLSPFFEDRHGNPSLVELRESAIRQIAKACEEWGFFQVINHGIPLDLFEEALAVSRTFFDYPLQQKMKIKSPEDSPLPTGYVAAAPVSVSQYEYLYYYAGDSESTFLAENYAAYNAMPEDPPRIRDVIEKLFTFRSTSALIGTLVAETLGLPEKSALRKLLKKNILILSHNLPPITAGDEKICGHQDKVCLSIVGQDQTGGYQVVKDGKWVDIAPIRGALVVNVGNVFQEVSNGRFKSAVHRVLCNRERSRYYFAFYF